MPVSDVLGSGVKGNFGQLSEIKQLRIVTGQIVNGCKESLNLWEKRPLPRAKQKPSSVSSENRKGELELFPLHPRLS